MGTGCSGQSRWECAAVQYQCTASAWNGWRQGGVFHGSAPPPPEENSSALSSCLGRNKHWQLISERGVSLDLDKQTDTLIEFERKAKRESKRRGHGEIAAERWSVTCRGRADVWLLRNHFWLQVLHLRERWRRRHGLSQWGIYCIADNIPVSHGAIFKPCTTHDVFHHITECAGFSLGHA